MGVPASLNAVYRIPSVGTGSAGRRKEISPLPRNDYCKSGFYNFNNTNR